MISKLKIPERFSNQLVKLPESGMGYQLVKVFLTNGKILRRHKIVNASYLLLEPKENISEREIEKIELE
jgi:hypothetical protein